MPHIVPLRMQTKTSVDVVAFIYASVAFYLIRLMSCQSHRMERSNLSREMLSRYCNSAFTTISLLSCKVRQDTHNTSWGTAKRERVFRERGRFARESLFRERVSECLCKSTLLCECVSVSVSVSVKCTLFRTLCIFDDSVVIDLLVVFSKRGCQCCVVAALGLSSTLLLPQTPRHCVFLSSFSPPPPLMPMRAILLKVSSLFSFLFFSLYQNETRKDLSPSVSNGISLRRQFSLVLLLFSLETTFLSRNILCVLVCVRLYIRTYTLSPFLCVYIYTCPCLLHTSSTTFTPLFKNRQMEKITGQSPCWCAFCWRRELISRIRD